MQKDPVARLPEYLEKISFELDRCIDFWFKHSHDEINGGFFTCLGKDGSIYDHTKYGWLQGRQVWTYARLYNSVKRFQRQDILEAAIKGAEFLSQHIKNKETQKCAFAVTKSGDPIKYQRTIFTECFYVLGMSELFKASNSDHFKQEAIEMMSTIVHWLKVDDSYLGNLALKGDKSISSLANPMMLMCLIDQMRSTIPEIATKYEKLEDECCLEILGHIQRNHSVVLENVSYDFKELSGCQGRLMNPGHTIEAGWFLLQYAELKNDNTLKNTALEIFLEDTFFQGWDNENGGLFYFLDVDGFSPTQLEWNMKLWWPHCEAMIAFLLAFKETLDKKFLEKFDQVFDYTMKHFCDPEYGELFGYLSQEGKISMNFKGGPFKGCFHVPRCLMMCERMLNQILDQGKNNN